MRLGADTLCHENEMEDPDVAMKYHEKKRFRKGRSSRRRRCHSSLDLDGSWRAVHCCHLHVRTCAGHSRVVATAQSGQLVTAWSTTTDFRLLHVPFSCDLACASTSQKSCGTSSSTAVDQDLSVLADLLVWRYSLQRFRPFEHPSQLGLLCWASQSWTSRQRPAS